MPNAFAHLMLAVWPVACFVLFRKYSMSRAFIMAVFVGYLLLPPQPADFDFPLLPPLNKLTLSNLSIFVIVLWFLGKRFQILPDNKAVRVLIAMFVLSPIATVLTNPEPVIFESGGLRGLWLRDAIALVITQAMTLLSFLVARQLLATKEAQRDLLIAFTIAGLVYSIPILIEVRLSPQLNLMFYGYFQHTFEQYVRAGGFRPIVFLSHGIWVAFFVMTAFVATLSLWRTNATQSKSWYLFGALYLLVILALCKTMAPLMYAIFLTPLVVFVPALLQIRIAAVLVALALLYPAMKGAGLVPAEAMLQQVESISTERAGSLHARFANEDLLLERAAEKPLFGWGSWGRNHLHDPVSGRILTIADGRWIIVLGVYGWIGFLAEFGLLAMPIFLVGYQCLVKARDIQQPLRSAPSVPLQRKFAPISPKMESFYYIGPLALLLAVNVVDLLPNATLTPMTWIIAGALLGHAELLARQRKQDQPTEGKDGLAAVLGAKAPATRVN